MSVKGEISILVLYVVLTRRDFNEFYKRELVSGLNCYGHHI